MLYEVITVNSETGQVVASTSVIGESGKRGYKLGYYGSALGGLTGMFGGEDADNVGQAAENAVGKAIEFMVKQLDSIAWEGSVMMVKGADKIIINRGEREGVARITSYNVCYTKLLRSCLHDFHSRCPCPPCASSG